MTVSIVGVSSFTVNGHVVIPDGFDARSRLDADGSLALDLSDCTLEASEPNAAGFTKTAWYELPLDYDQTETARVVLASATSTGAVALYKSTLDLSTEVDSDTDDDEDDPASITALALVQAASDDQRFTLDADYDGSYYLQVGLLTGTGDDFVLTWGDADPDEGGTFDTAIPTGGSSAYLSASADNAWLEDSEPVPAGLTPIRSVWFQWQAPVTDPSLDPDLPQFIQASTDQTTKYAVTVYTGDTLTGLTQVATAAATAPDLATLSFVPTAETVYMVQVTTESQDADFDVEWFSAPTTSPAADAVQHLRVEIWDNTGTSLITEVPNRVGSQFQEALNVPGNSTLTLPLSDPVLQAYATASDPFDLVKFGNIVKFWMGDTCVSGFIIKSREVNMVSDTESAGENVVLTGPTVHFLLDDFMVWPDADLDSLNTDSRSYSWNAMPGDWYDASDWDDHTNTNTMRNPPGGKKGQKAENRPKYALFKRKRDPWPDKHAKWMWISQNPDKNEGHWKPKRKIKGLHYYRTTVSVTHGGRTYRMSATADDYYQIFVDGVAFLSNDGNESYKTFKQKKLQLTKGKHTIAVFVRDKGKSNSGDRNEAFLFTLQQVNAKGKVVATLKRSSGKWKAWHGSNPPGFNRALVLRSLVTEARGRSIAAAQALNISGWDGTTDANGQKWRDDTNVMIKIGTSALDLASQFSESGKFDVWVEPGSMKLQAANRRGTNRSTSVVLAPGYNLMVWSVSESDDIKNSILAQYHGGWVKVKSPGSISKFGEREGYLEFGGLHEEKPVKDLVTALLENLGRVTRVSGSPDVVWHKETYDGSLIAVAGAVPFLDFNVGDTVAAPGQDKVLHPQRVLSLTCTEDANGGLTFDPELGDP